MTVYYVGAGGNDANSGLNWGARKLTLNGAENVPVVAGDTVYVAPGVYRETLTCDVSGGAGSPITYIGDVSGENTDGVGGVVRVTGSDNDQTATRLFCITWTTQRDYRTFRGFMFDTTTSPIIYVSAPFPSAGRNWIIEDCTFQGGTSGNIICYGANQLNWTIRRCVFCSFYNVINIQFTYSSLVDNAGHLVEDCIFIGYKGIVSTRIGGIIIKNCDMINLHLQAVLSEVALTAGQTITVNNCVLVGCAGTTLSSAAAGNIVEDYNVFYKNNADKVNCTSGGHSVVYSPLLDLGLFHSGASQVSGFRFPPPLFGSLSQWSQLRAIADTAASTEDILGLTRPVTAGKRSWGAVQYVDMIRDTTNPRTGIACKELQDAGREQIRVPTAAVSMVFSVWVYRGANYAGVNPQMIIKQPGQADVTVTDAGAAGVYNQLTTTLTPAALPGYVVIELVSNNTAAAGAYGVYFDDLTALEA